MASTSTFASWSPFAVESNPISVASQICHDIGCMLESSTGAQLIENFQRAIDDIFAINDGFGGQQFAAPFSLLTITPNSMTDFQAYYDLLNVNGPVFRAIDRVMRLEPNLRYHAQTLDQGGAVSRFPTEVSRSPKETNFLKLNPFEYHFFRFAQHLLTASNTYPHADFDRLECVYVALLIDYLNSFLPADGVFPTSLASISATAASTSVDHGSGRYLLSDQHSNHIRGTPFGLLRRELFRENVPASGFASPKPQATKFSDILWKSVAAASILLDVWFTVPGSQSMSVSSSFAGNIPKVGFAGPSVRCNALISGVVAVVNRTLVEHLHHFAYGPSSSIIDAQFRDFKERYVPKLLDNQIWAFLQYVFEKWPLDSSFRLLLELWFAYVQPWRYAYGNYQQQAQGERNYDDRWESFVKEHLGFYTTFFRAAMARFLRMDLTAYKNAFTLYRTAHVISQSNLTTALGWVNSGQLSPTRLGDFDGQYRADIGKVVAAVAERAREASKVCQKVIVERRMMERRQTWASWFFDLMMGQENENSQLIELSRARESLDVAVQSFEVAFGFRLSDEVRNGGIQQDSFKTPFHAEKEPDCRPDDDGRLHLTPLGRRQLLNANRRFDFSRVPMPSDLAPVDPSMEVGFLAQFLQSLSSKVNATYARQFEILYRQPRGVVAWVLRKCLEPPTRIARKNSPVIERQPTELKARINLRPLASYRFLFKFCFLMICLGLFLGFPAILFTMTAVLTVFLACFYFVLEYHPKVRRVDG